MIYLVLISVLAGLQGAEFISGKSDRYGAPPNSQPFGLLFGPFFGQPTHRDFGVGRCRRAAASGEMVVRRTWTMSHVDFTNEVVRYFPSHFSSFPDGPSNRGCSPR